MIRCIPVDGSPPFEVEDAICEASYVSHEEPDRGLLRWYKTTARRAPSAQTTSSKSTVAPVASSRGVSAPNGSSKPSARSPNRTRTHAGRAGSTGRHAPPTRSGSPSRGDRRARDLSYWLPSSMTTQRRTVRVSPLVPRSKRGGSWPRLWAYGYADLARLVGKSGTPFVMTSSVAASILGIWRASSPTRTRRPCVRSGARRRLSVVRGRCRRSWLGAPSCKRSPHGCCYSTAFAIADAINVSVGTTR